MLDTSSGSTVALVDLETGTSMVPWTDTGTGGTMVEPSNITAFTPDSRYLLIANDHGVSVIDAAGGNPLGRLPVPPLVALAIRPVE